MPVYVILGKYTQEGIAKIKTSPKKIEAARKLFESIRGEIKDFYYTMGQYDLVVVCEAPDVEAMTKALLIIAGKGEVRTETLPAIPADKAAEIFKELP